MRERHQARELAMKFLFQNEFSSPISFESFQVVIDPKPDVKAKQYAKWLIEGVDEKLEEIDAVIKGAIRHWKMERIGIVELSILRLACFEMIFASEPLRPNIAINEAVELAKKYGHTESGSFVNGVLDQISKTKISNQGSKE
jgi:transcription antitermination protein NusB